MRSALALPVLLTTTLLQAQSGVPLPFDGKAEMQRFIEEEMRYPAEELGAQRAGSVTVVFTVHADGRTEDFRVLRSVTPACDAEALRLAGLVRWLPAQRDGQAIASEQMVQIDFDPKRFERLQKKRPPQESKDDMDASGALYTATQLDSLPEPLIDGGVRGLPLHLGRNMRYPKDAFARSIEGTVHVEFTVETSGRVANVRALEQVGGGCTDEALRLVRTIRWKPGRKNGKRVRSIQEVGIVFKLGTTQR
ncbi:MAG: TonB family protein [Flavobacteriales bacterium]|nr:MAG: TonB family protein [Flavobacteriales bacterium]